MSIGDPTQYPWGWESNTLTNSLSSTLEGPLCKVSTGAVSHTNLWIQVIEHPEHAPLVRTGRDVAEVVRALDLLVPEPVGELQGDLQDGLKTVKLFFVLMCIYPTPRYITPPFIQTISFGLTLPSIYCIILSGL